MVILKKRMKQIRSKYTFADYEKRNIKNEEDYSL
jgi:hypothetical protein